MDTLKALDYIHRTFKPFSRERMGSASKSEIQRWFDQGAVEIDGKRFDWKDEIDWRPASVVLFPKGKRVTLW